MKLEDQVCSLELSCKLKELGVKQDSLFYWIIDDEDDGPIESRSILNRGYIDGIDSQYSAFTVSELLKILPSIHNSEPQLIRGYLFGDTQLKYCCRYGWQDEENHKFVDERPENSCAKMLIYLLENGLIKI